MHDSGYWSPPHSEDTLLYNYRVNSANCSINSWWLLHCNIPAVFYPVNAGVLSQSNYEEYAGIGPQVTTAITLGNLQSQVKFNDIIISYRQDLTL